MQMIIRSIADFIQRVFKNEKLAELVTYHAEHISDNGDILDFQDGETYKHLMQDDRFKNDPRNLMMALIADGVQPWTEDNKYSIWPIAATFYNWPPWLRYVSSQHNALLATNFLLKDIYDLVCCHHICMQ